MDQLLEHVYQHCSQVQISVERIHFKLDRALMDCFLTTPRIRYNNWIPSYKLNRDHSRLTCIQRRPVQTPVVQCVHFRLDSSVMIDPCLTTRPIRGWFDGTVDLVLRELVVTILCRLSEHTCIHQHHRLVHMSVQRVHTKLKAIIDPGLITPHV
jgi:hypothetical protein